MSPQHFFKVIWWGILIQLIHHRELIIDMQGLRSGKNNYLTHYLIMIQKSGG